MADNYDFGNYTYEPLDFGSIGGGGGGFTGTGSIGFKPPSMPDVGFGYDSGAGSYTPIDFSNLYSGGRSGGGFQLPSGGIPQMPGMQAPAPVNIPQYIPQGRTADAYTGAGFRLPGQLPAGPVAQATGAPGVAAPGADQSLMQRAEAFAKENPTLMRLLGSVGTAGIGSLLSGQAQRSAGQLQKQLSPLGKTQREEGQRLVAAAQRGELTAPQQQQLDAFKAQQAQALASRGLSGGTAEQQLMGQVEAMRQQMLQQNLQTGLQLLGIGDSYTQQAISAGYNASQDASALSRRFYELAAQNMFGQPTQQQQPQQQPQR